MVKSIPKLIEEHIIENIIKEKLGIYKLRLIYYNDNITKNTRLERYEILNKDGTILNNIPNNETSIIFIKAIDDLFWKVGIQYTLYLVNQKKEISLRQLSIKSGISYPAVCSFIEILHSYGFINIREDNSNKLKTKLCSVNKNFIEIFTK